ncbi:hypothetical protein H0E87_031089, partial [Populus deltoides]
MEGVTASSIVDDVNLISNESDGRLQLLLKEVSGNDQDGQNNVINDSIQQTTQFPPSFPQTM